MRYLLDTQAFIWYDNDPAQLSTKAMAVCRDPANTLLLSIASIWEIQIKIQLGKLTLPTSLLTTIQNQQQSNNLQLLAIEFNHILGLDRLQDHHKDPFDRLLVAQSLVEGIPIISSDLFIAKYPVTIVW